VSTQLPHVAPEKIRWTQAGFCRPGVHRGHYVYESYVMLGGEVMMERGHCSRCGADCMRSDCR
jgi:hypothetical protein